MAATMLDLQATAGSTYVVNAAFDDEDGNPVTPNNIEWSLKDEGDNVINSRSAVSETPATNIDVLLQGDDLDPGSCDVRKLFLTITADYDSSLGSGLPFLSQCAFLVGALEPSD